MRLGALFFRSLNSIKKKWQGSFGGVRSHFLWEVICEAGRIFSHFPLSSFRLRCRKRTIMGQLVFIFMIESISVVNSVIFVYVSLSNSTNLNGLFYSLHFISRVHMHLFWFIVTQIAFLAMSFQDPRLSKAGISPHSFKINLFSVFWLFTVCQRLLVCCRLFIIYKV